MGKLERMVVLVTRPQKRSIASRAKARRLPMGERIRRSVESDWSEEDAALLERRARELKGSSAGCGARAPCSASRGQEDAGAVTRKMAADRTIATLRKWGGAIAVSLPKKVLAMLGLRAGAQLEVRVAEGNIVLTPARRRCTLERLEKEQRALERTMGGHPMDKEWLDGSARGR